MGENKEEKFIYTVMTPSGQLVTMTGSLYKKYHEKIDKEQRQKIKKNIKQGIINVKNKK